jgi:hypothetical protein
MYDTTISPNPVSLPSLGFEATSTSELGQQIAFAPGTSRTLGNVVVDMEDWACQTGGDSTCVTTPGSTFAQPITLNIYNVGPSNAVGSLIESVTQTFDIPFRPSSGTCTTDPTAYLGADGVCHHGILAPVTFTFPTQVALPDSLVYGVAFNPTDHGYDPTGVAGPYDSLNVALNNLGAGPSVGSDPAGSDSIYWNTSYAGFTCNGSSGSFQIDDGLRDGCWNSEPAVQFNGLPADTVAFSSAGHGSTVVGGPAYTPTATGGGSTSPVLISLDASSTGCALNAGLVSFTSVGTCLVDVNQAGDANYTAAPQQQQSIPVGRGTPTTPFVQNLSASYVWGATLNATVSTNGDGTKSVTSSTSSVCTASGLVVSFTGTHGTCTLVAHVAAGTNYTGADGSSVSTQVLAATPTAPTVSNLPASVTGTNGDGAASVTGTNGDGATSVTSKTTSVCTTSGLVVTYGGVGTCTLDAQVALGSHYAARTGSDQSITVGQATPSTPTISNLPAGGYLGGGFTAVVATTGDGATSVTSSTSSVCTTSGLVVTYVGVGSCTLVAHVAAGTDYLAGDGAARGVTVLGLTVTTTALPDATRGTAYGPVTLTETGAGTSTAPFHTRFKWYGAELPKGMRVSAGGVLSGTPTSKLVPGTYEVHVSVTETVYTSGPTGRQVKTSTTADGTIPLTVR